MGIVVVTVGYGAWLLPGRGTGLPPWLATAAVLLGLAAVVPGGVGRAVAGPWRRRGAPRGDARRCGAPLHPRRGQRVGGGRVTGPLRHAVPARAPCTTVVHTVFAPQPSPPGLAAIEAARRGAPYLMAAQTSAVAAPFIYATGEEVLPLGGYTGTTPAPSVARTRSMIAQGLFHLALLAAPTATPSARFIAAHCLRVPAKRGRVRGPEAARLRLRRLRRRRRTVPWVGGSRRGQAGRRQT